MPTEADLSRLLSATNLWWQNRPDWERDDPDLSKALTAPFEHDPGALEDIRPDGLYMLLGPRRAGKSVEIKKTISRLINHYKVHPRRIIHFACDGLSKDDLHRLVRVAREQQTAMVSEPRYWFLDEITDVEKGWPGTIKYLRDNLLGFSTDCVVLTGSSSRDLNEARKALAGRRGNVSKTERYLFPMSFRQFGMVTGHTSVPLLDPIPARRWVTDEARAAVETLLPWLDELANLWEIYCTIGGYPRAVEGFLTDGAVSDGFLQDLWDVIHGEALVRTSQTHTPTQTDLLISGLAARLTQPMNLSGLADEVGYASHHTAGARLDAMDMAYFTWRCYPSREGRWFPVEKAQYKSYFTDPLLARLAALRSGGAFEPPRSAISEQQLGHLLLRHRETEQMGTLSSFVELLSIRTPTDKEIDFAGAWTEGVAFEGKYVDERLKRESQTAQAQIDAGTIRAAVLATRAAYSLEDPVWAVPAGILAWLLAA